MGDAAGEEGFEFAGVDWRPGAFDAGDERRWWWGGRVCEEGLPLSIEVDKKGEASIPP